MATTNIKLNQSNKGLEKAGKMLLRILSLPLVFYLAFFCYAAAHEWAGHILGDSLVFARHGTTFAKLEVIVQWLEVNLQDGRWSMGLVPFRIGGKVISAIPHDLFTITDWERGLGDLSGSGMTALISLTALTVLNLRKQLRHFPWFIVFFILFSLVFDQVLYTFTGADPEPLVSAVLMGVNPLLFKGIVIGLALLQVGLLVRLVLCYRRSRRAIAQSA